MAKHCVVRTDLMAGTKNPDQLVSLRFYSSAQPAAVDNGIIAELEGYEDGQREVFKAKAATSSSNLADCVLIASPEVMYDERKKNLDDFVNEAGKIARGYRLVDRNVFSATAEAFTTPPAVKGKVGIGEGGKMDSSTTGFGECVAIEEVGRYKYYTIKITREGAGA